MIRLQNVLLLRRLVTPILKTLKRINRKIVFKKIIVLGIVFTRASKCLFVQIYNTHTMVQQENFTFGAFNLNNLKYNSHEKIMDNAAARRYLLAKWLL